MKKKRKTIAAFLAVISLAGLAGGCSTSLGRAGKDRVSISVAWGTHTEEREKAQERINNFRKIYGDIEVRPDTWILDTATYYMKASTGRLPTVFSVVMTEAERLKNSGFGIDITEYVEKYQYDRYINKEIKDVVTVGGAYYSLPIDAYLLGVVFNANLFEQAGLKNPDGTYMIPKTYEELAETAKIITEKTGVPGLLLETDKRVGGWLFSNIAWSFGVEFIKYESGKWVAAFDTPECVEAFRYISDLNWKFRALAQNPHTDQQQAQKRLIEGKCAMIFEGGVSSIFGLWGGDKNSVGMFSMPEGPKGKYVLLGGKVYGFSNVATPEELDAAFQWLDYSSANPSGKKGVDLEKNIEDSYLQKYNKALPIGLKKYSIWTEDSPRRKIEEKMIEKYTNVPIELYQDYNDMVSGKTVVKIRPEEPVCCQDLYLILTDCLKEIYESPDVDLEKMVSDACRRFQSEYLDKIN